MIVSKKQDSQQGCLPAIELTSKEMEDLSSWLEVMPPSPHNFPLFYQGHVPIVVYFVLKGEILLSDHNDKSILTLGTGHLLGLAQFHYNIAAEVTARALPFTSLAYLDRSSFHEVLASQSNAAEVLKNYLAIFEASTLKNA